MNALANSQYGELEKFLRMVPRRQGPGPVRPLHRAGDPTSRSTAIVAEPAGHPADQLRDARLILTRPQERNLVKAAQGLRFLVLDELHTYRGRQGSDVALLVRRVRDALRADATPVRRHLGHAGRRGNARRAAAAGRPGRVATCSGPTVRPENVIGETLRRATAASDLDDSAFRDRLARRVADPGAVQPGRLREFVADPLSCWIESHVRAPAGAGERPAGPGHAPAASPGRGRGRRTGRRRRACPRSGAPRRSGWAPGAATAASGTPRPASRPSRSGSTSSSAGATPSTPPSSPRTSGTSPSRASSSSLATGDRVLLPLVFCRECGQEYYSVRSVLDAGHGADGSTCPRDSDRSPERGRRRGRVPVRRARPALARRPGRGCIDRCPTTGSRSTDGRPRVQPHPRKRSAAARPCRPGRRGEPDGGLDCHFLPPRSGSACTAGSPTASAQTTDFGKLATLSSEGRSTATTILSLSADPEPAAGRSRSPEQARKLLSFTDNRQDAPSRPALQRLRRDQPAAVGPLQGRARRRADGTAHDELTQQVFNALDLPSSSTPSSPSVRFAAKVETKQALRDVLGYRLYRDLKRGWRVTSPNLEQCGLLEIQYLSLDEVCAAEDVWQGTHPALAVASRRRPGETIATVLLDFMRRELAIKVDYLTHELQERIQLSSSQQRLDRPVGHRRERDAWS